MKNFFLLMLLPIITECGPSGEKNQVSAISAIVVENTTARILEAFPEALLAGRGVEQAAALWRPQDGTPGEFTEFCVANFAADTAARQMLFKKLETAFEQFFGTANQLSVALKKPVQLEGDELTEIDYIMGNYDPSAHFSDDMFGNKSAFICVLNFPNYTLAEKDSLGKDWTRLEWAYARMGDLFTSRVPAELKQEMSLALGNAENYIAEYNILMGRLLTENGERLFPEDMVLLSHWNLRDEIKSNYASVPNALEKQRMIYKVMEHIACQTIPECVINNPTCEWAPFSNTVFREGEKIQTPEEADRRYGHLLDICRAEMKLDAYYPQMPTGIIRNFEGGMEISAKEIEELFIHLISSPQVGQVARLIQQRLGRPLEPFDIWYDGFKSRTALPEDELTAVTRKKYPNPGAFQNDMPRMLSQLGFPSSEATDIAGRIVVEGARGSGHAWGASGRWEPARLRTRIGSRGMDYKGYNIAVHEFGHNVEQTLSLYYVDHYMLNGVPNTAFTEALAFVFQKRDLGLLGYSQQIDTNTTLDIFWGCYEIMGVSLVDMYVWQWLYENPGATPALLKKAVLEKAREVWNKWYEPVLGQHDSPILAIYSHMINSPMYLPNYPMGHIIEFQLEDYFAGDMKENGRNLAGEIKRIYTQGTLVPQLWMEGAVGHRISTDPLLNAVEDIISRHMREL